jgi:hypothetical protein
VYTVNYHTLNTELSFTLYTQSVSIEDLPLDLTGRNFTTSECMEEEGFNNCLVIIILTQF